MALDRGKRAGFDRLKAVANNLKQEITVQRSLSVAKKRQQYMLPRVPDVPGYEFAFVYHPAEHVSGDFLDIIDLGNNRYGMLVGDISGHGFEAGLIMGAARKAMQIYARSAESPKVAFGWANDDLANDLDRQTFLTASYAVLDAGTGMMQCVRAGHTHPLLVGPASDQWEEVKSNGTSIGVTRGERFTQLLQEVSVQLRPGQTLIQYTDGVIEAHDRRGREFEVSRFIEFFCQRAIAGHSVAAAIEDLPERLDRWTEGAPQEDDITVLAVRRMP